MYRNPHTENKLIQLLPQINWCHVRERRPIYFWWFSKCSVDMLQRRIYVPPSADGTCFSVVMIPTWQDSRYITSKCPLIFHTESVDHLMRVETNICVYILSKGVRIPVELFLFNFVQRPLWKVWIHLFSLHIWVNSKIDWTPQSLSLWV